MQVTIDGEPYYSLADIKEALERAYNETPGGPDIDDILGLFQGRKYTTLRFTPGSVHASKIRCIKVLRSIHKEIHGTFLGLADAKRAVEEGTPLLVEEGKAQECIDLAYAYGVDLVKS